MPEVPRTDTGLRTLKGQERVFPGPRPPTSSPSSPTPPQTPSGGRYCETVRSSSLPYWTRGTTWDLRSFVSGVGRVGTQGTETPRPGWGLPVTRTPGRRLGDRRDGSPVLSPGPLSVPRHVPRLGHGARSGSLSFTLRLRPFALGFLISGATAGFNLLFKDLPPPSTASFIAVWGRRVDSRRSRRRPTIRVLPRPPPSSVFPHGTRVGFDPCGPSVISPRTPRGVGLGIQG